MSPSVFFFLSNNLKGRYFFVRNDALHYPPRGKRSAWVKQISLKVDEQRDDRGMIEGWSRAEPDAALELQGAYRSIDGARGGGGGAIVCDPRPSTSPVFCIKYFISNIGVIDGMVKNTRWRPGRGLLFSYFTCHIPYLVHYHSMITW